MSNITHIGTRTQRSACDTCNDDHDDDFSHTMGQCEPVVDDDTRWQLLVLLSDMVKIRDNCGYPEVHGLIDKLGKIIERHEPKP